MVDTSQYIESQYLTAEMVRNSPTKVAVIIGEAKPEKTDYGEKLTATVEIDKKRKIWRMNRDTVKNLHEVSKESCDWNGMSIKLQVVSIQGKDSIIGVPQLKKPSEEAVN